MLSVFAKLKAMSFTLGGGSEFHSAMTKSVIETFTYVSKLNLVPGKEKRSLGLTSAPEPGRCENTSQADHTCLPALKHGEKMADS